MIVRLSSDHINQDLRTAGIYTCLYQTELMCTFIVFSFERADAEKSTSDHEQALKMLKRGVSSESERVRYEDLTLC